ncbi:MAG: 2-oxo acid dehydrogenase subunit E2 [Saprospiraceae bacterium]|jgi:2-oxoglutarate dehydrogenase E2 component (dihydrolipoamide succinyltransferase)|nr:2-oxo acid dehydrogenase subunit E2 [Saprospiraceae bacterium]
MAQVELIMPKMGESIMEATILRWVKQVGDRVEADETILEIATDKVDSEVPSPVSGTIAQLFFKENDVVPIGKVIAVIATEGEAVKPTPSVAETPAAAPAPSSNGNGATQTPAQVTVTAPVEKVSSTSGRFYSPLVRTIAQKEQIGMSELDHIAGSGAQGRVTKKDILEYVQNRSAAPAAPAQPQIPQTPQPSAPKAAPAVSISGEVEIVEMDRMRKLIADHMVMSKHTSPHVTSFVEVDVTNMVKWREKNKKAFLDKYGENITYTPIFIEAVVKAIRDYPNINISLDGTRIIRKKYINIGMATALPSGNLIVPVIKNADQLNLLGLTKQVNELANRARNNQLKPDEIQDGTFTLTNVGTFGNVMGTPIINQPQVAIMAIGAIRKKPAVVETEYGDLIAVRHMMFLSLSYDHRIVDGFLGGSFLRKVGDYLEAFDSNMPV